MRRCNNKNLKGVITRELRISTKPRWVIKRIAELFQLFILVTTRNVKVFPITAVTNTQHRITEIDREFLRSNLFWTLGGGGFWVLTIIGDCM